MNAVATEDSQYKHGIRVNAVATEDSQYISGEVIGATGGRPLR